MAGAGAGADAWGVAAGAGGWGSCPWRRGEAARGVGFGAQPGWGEEGSGREEALGLCFFFFFFEDSA